MSKDVTIYECGLRLDNKYSSFMQSRSEKEIDEYVGIMKSSCDRGEIVKIQKIYRCISTTPLNVINTAP